ncbi:hypothetical protein TNCT_648371 [Trichonephila clavata]|uniref:Uncharacterized protein n=1 Tax=Trichonephila clavata TaxID=2740835 RepID=A0A8X6H826_TRICU|nr:hypothetical protein TNCT_648371 [Trichonephila clavata]
MLKRTQQKMVCTCKFHSRIAQDEIDEDISTSQRDSQENFSPPNDSLDNSTGQVLKLVPSFSACIGLNPSPQFADAV